jgi:SAM-dependent methyltransferase
MNEVSPARRVAKQLAFGDVTDVEPYGTLAEVYEWLVPDALLQPEGAVAAFATVVDDLLQGAHALDCAAGTGQLAVGLALRGFDAVATDASRAMIERTLALAGERGARLRAEVCTWEGLADQGWDGAFDAVFCVGNSLTHAAGEAGRRAALAGMAGVLREGGLLAVTSRNWEKVREAGPGLQVAESVTERASGRALVVHAWNFAATWEEPHYLDVEVAVLGGDGGVRSYRERLEFWPFSHEDLDADLRAAGLEPVSSTYTAEEERYLVVARRG